jgi:hypothetical protein
MILNYRDFCLNEDDSTGGPAGAVASSSVGGGGNGVAYSNASIGGMGSVVAAQPSIYAGVTLDPGYSLGGGTVGSGDISIPYNSGPMKVFQKIKNPLDSRRGSAKRRRNKEVEELKNALSPKKDYTASKGVNKMKIVSFDKFKEMSKEPLTF